VWSSVSSSQRILSLWLERLSTDRFAKPWRKSYQTSQPCVVFGRRANLDIVVAVDATAEQVGLKQGVALAQARAMHPHLIAAPEDQAADTLLLEALADWCQRYTPLVALDGCDGILLDISGCAHLFGSEHKLRHDLLARVRELGFSARAAIASTIGVAWAAARFDAIPIALSGQERELLAPLPLAALRLPTDTVAELARLGLKRIGDLLDLPRAPLVARFGMKLLRNLDRALGREDEPLTPRHPVAPYMAERSFPEPIAHQEGVLATIELLAVRMQVALISRGEGARSLELALFRTEGAVKRVTTGTSRPLRDPAAIRALFVERLARAGDEIDPGFGFDLVRLSALVAEPCPDEQIGLGTCNEPVELDRLIDRLSARLGRNRVGRLAAKDNHIPELAAQAIPAQTASRVDLGWGRFRHFRSDVGLSIRPLRLLARPEPLNDLLALVPDGPPVRFRWRRAWHEVIAAEGPERIAGAWWSHDGGGPTRDYFQVEDRDGLRFWLFRSGLYREGGCAPGWFMHGLYA
jgi:protein ImuB